MIKNEKIFLNILHDGIKKAWDKSMITQFDIVNKPSELRKKIDTLA